jgi:hypothetical protein
MQLKDVTASITVEIVGGEDGQAADGQAVTITLNGDTGSGGHPLGRVTGTVPALVTWLGTVYGLVNEDILVNYLPGFEVQSPSDQL